MVTEEEIQERERAVQGRKVIGSSGRFMKKKNFTMKVRKIIEEHSSASPNFWELNMDKECSRQFEDSGYLRGASGIRRWDELMLK